MAQEAPFGRSQSSRPIPQGVGGASTSDPSSSPPEEAPQEPLGGWEYEWIPQNRVLRYSQDQVNQDRNKALRLSTARKEQEQAALTGRRSHTSRGRRHHDPGEGSTSGRMPPPPPKRGRSERVRRESGSRGASCRAAAEDPQQDATPGRCEVQVDPPMSLRPMLILDWDMVTLRKMLCNLPAKVSADAILYEYASFPLKHRTRDQSCAVWGLVAVLKEYFNVLLSPQLLYDFERPQYDELVVSYPSSQICELYGGIHLLRLFEHLGPMLTCTALDDSSMNVLLSHLQDFLDYLAHNSSLLFFDTSDYEPASAEHLKLVA
ncbi:mortality factor 4-like protein 2 [Notamacropus eugenii]|uniref:mortality factor 4-like protein 2 n=1 Tax=Notamacropus eugenii TaxID=9315 RepID=UPI003B676E28